MMPMYNLIEYSGNYSKTAGSCFSYLKGIWQYYRYQPNDTITDSELFKLKVRITARTSVDDNVKEVEIAVPLKYFSSFCRTLEMLLISSEINLMLPWSAKWRYYLFNWYRNIHNNQFRISCSSSNFINSR